MRGNVHVQFLEGGSCVLRGHYAYYGLPSNWHRLDTFYDEVRRLWYRVLQRRSQRSLSWARFYHLLERSPLPTPRITHPHPVVIC
jgi:RNA-directed DNA polymerase